MYKILCTAVTSELEIDVLYGLSKDEFKTVKER